MIIIEFEVIPLIPVFWVQPEIQGSNSYEKTPLIYWEFEALGVQTL